MKTVEELVAHMKEKYDVTLNEQMQKQVECIRMPVGKNDYPSANFVAPNRGAFAIHRMIEKGEVIFTVADTYLTPVS